MGYVLCCPDCGSSQLEPHGQPSLLDGKRRRRCLSCGRVLSPRRSRLALGVAFGFALAVTGVCLAYILVLGSVTDYWIAGLIAGPTTMVMSGTAMFSRMPVYGPPRNKSAGPGAATGGV